MHWWGRTVTDATPLLIDFEKVLKEQSTYSISIYNTNQGRDKQAKPQANKKVKASRDLGEPANYKTAMLDPDKVIWQGAMDEEMNSMKVNEVWTEVDPPPNAKIVRSKWLFKKKTDMDGISVNPKYPNRICKLQRSIYGLKQASRQWNKRFDEEIKRFGFTQNRDEPVYKSQASGKIYHNAVRCTRPDVAIAQNFGQFDIATDIQERLHWVACNAIKTMTKSQTGYVFVVNVMSIYWKSKKQTTIAMHATQSEYMAASEAAMEAVWIRKFVGDLGGDVLQY
ncbi:retrotransposon protein, putative, ty1-copia subclass [Tanacetum coccineum]